MKPPPRETTACAPQATQRVVEANGGACFVDTPVDALITDADGSCGGVSARGVDIAADCVVASPEAVPQHAAPGYAMVRLYAVLAHPPNLCKEASSCQVILPAEHCGRSHDICARKPTAERATRPRGGAGLSRSRAPPRPRLP